MDKESFFRLFKDCSLSKSKGAFLSDKSYKFDTLYYVAIFVLNHCDDYGIFDKSYYRSECCLYIEKTFNLKSNSSASINYCTEVINLLEFSNVLERVGRGKYQIKNYDVMKFITESFENSYVFLFLLTYYTFQNDGMLDLYFTYKKQQNIETKKELLSNIEILLSQKSFRGAMIGSVWSKMMTKYPITILGYYYEDFHISRMFNIDSNKINLRHLSMNNAGTRTPHNLVKDNFYLTTIDEKYIKTTIGKLIYNEDKNV